MIEQRIRELLAARQLSPTQFADTIGISRPIVSHILSGRNKPSLEVVQKIISAFPDLALPWLLSGTGPMQSNQQQEATETAPVRALRRRHERSVALEAPEPVAAPEALPAATERAPAPVAPVSPEVLPPVEPVASEVAPPPPALGPPNEAAIAPLFTQVDKRIRRIVIFYEDGTFSDFRPE